MTASYTDQPWSSQTVAGIEKGSEGEAVRAALYVAGRLAGDVEAVVDVLDALGLRERLRGQR